jgi:hypothetical protein
MVQVVNVSELMGGCAGKSQNPAIEKKELTVLVCLDEKYKTQSDQLVGVGDTPVTFVPYANSNKFFSMS